MRRWQGWVGKPQSTEQLLCSVLKALFFCFFGHVACRILVPSPGTEPMPPAMEAWSLTYWTAKEVLGSIFLNMVSARVSSREMERSKRENTKTGRDLLKYTEK